LQRVIQETEITSKETLEELERQIREKIEIEYDWAIYQRNPRKKKKLLKALKQTWCKEEVLAQIVKTKENNQKKTHLKIHIKDII
jgi:predicted DsbA family dithiol-disulfide isomerase